VSGTDEMTDLYGLSRRSPYVALVMLLALLSLGGIPPTAGFFGKFFLFKAAVDAGLWWLALIGVINAFVALYYYLNVVKYMYLYQPEGEHAEVSIPVSRAAGVALAVTSIGILVLGVIPETIFELTQQAASLFYPFN
jgi:NADH-quinone oxidoreductase subunit N